MQATLQQRPHHQLGFDSSSNNDNMASATTTTSTTSSAGLGQSRRDSTSQSSSGGEASPDLQDFQSKSSVTTATTSTASNLRRVSSDLLTQPTFNSPAEEAQFEADKKTIYKHPLFPVLALLFEKCEMATQSIDGSGSESFNADIRVFVEQQKRDDKPLLSDNQEANELVRKTELILQRFLI